jgi:PadR family transcriptional regulator PadR
VTAAMAKPTDLLPGTLDMLILKAVSLKPLHGYGVLLRIGQMSGNALEIPQGSLYPALYRLEHQRLISAKKAKYYRLSAAGRKRFKEETAYWRRFSEAMGFALEAMPEDV